MNLYHEFHIKELACLDEKIICIALNQTMQHSLLWYLSHSAIDSVAAARLGKLQYKWLGRAVALALWKVSNKDCGNVA